jgi:hypothetical protein
MRVLDLDGNPLTRDQLVLEGEPMTNPMTNPKILAARESAKLLDRLAPDWPLLLYDGAVIDHILKVINNARTPHKGHASSRLPSRRPPRTRRKTILTLPGPLASSGPQESSSDQVKRLA